VNCATRLWSLDSGLDRQTKRDKKGEQWFKRLDERREYPNQKAETRIGADPC